MSWGTTGNMLCYECGLIIAFCCKAYVVECDGRPRGKRFCAPTTFTLKAWPCFNRYVVFLACVKFDALRGAFV